LLLRGIVDEPQKNSSPGLRRAAADPRRFRCREASPRPLSRTIPLLSLSGASPDALNHPILQRCAHTTDTRSRRRLQPPLCLISGRDQRRRSSFRHLRRRPRLVLVSIATEDHRSVADVEFQHRTLAADDLTGTLISELPLPFFCTVGSRSGGSDFMKHRIGTLCSEPPDALKIQQLKM
jgi:hypothetical protein